MLCYKMNPRRSTPRCIVIKMAKRNENGNLLKQQEKTVTNKGKLRRDIS